MIRIEDEQLASSHSDHAWREAKISISFYLVEAERLEKTIQSTHIRYPISIYLGEPVKISAESAFLPFAIIVDTKPEIASFRIEGKAFVEGAPHTVSYYIATQNDEPPKVWSRVYQEITGMLSELAKHLGVPAPNFDDELDLAS